MEIAHIFNRLLIITLIKLNKIFKRTIQLSDLCPTGFKYGINYQSLTVIAGVDLANFIGSCCIISYSTAIVEVFSRINHKFEELYKIILYFNNYK